jgi:hypothetical protein
MAFLDVKKRVLPRTAKNRTQFTANCLIRVTVVPKILYAIMSTCTDHVAICRKNTTANIGIGKRLVIRTWAVRKLRTAICYDEMLNLNPRRRNIRRILDPWFTLLMRYSTGCISETADFLTEKVFSGHSLGLIYYFIVSSQLPSRETVPLTLFTILLYIQNHITK